MLLGTGWDSEKHRYENFKEQKTKYEMVNGHGTYYLQSQKDMEKFSESYQ